MRFTTYVLAAAALLALATPVFSAPIEDNSVADINCDGCSAEFALTLRFSAAFNERMGTTAHKLYEEALKDYYEVNSMFIHLLGHNSVDRFDRFEEVGNKVQEAWDLLDQAALANKGDRHFLRRKWVQHEIDSLKRKLEHSRLTCIRLPNLCFVEHAFKFIVKETEEVVEAVVGVAGAVVIGVEIGLEEAAEKCHRAFHHFRVKLHWAVDEFAHFIHHIGHEIKVGLKEVGHELHHIGHEIKIGFEDAGAIVADKIHHFCDRMHHHHCCDGSSSSSSSECQEIIGSSSGSSSSSSSSSVSDYVEWSEQVARTECIKTVREVKTTMIEVKEEVIQTQKEVVVAKWSD